MLYPARLSFRIEGEIGEIKSFPDMTECIKKKKTHPYATYKRLILDLKTLAD